MSLKRLAILGSAALAAACGARGARDATLLPTGLRLDPAGNSMALGSMPLAMALAPGGGRLVVMLSGYREQGIQVVDRASGRLVQTLAQPAAFLGLAFAPDGKRLYASGGDRDLIYVYAWAADTAALVDSLPLAMPRAPAHGARYPAGLAVSPDGRRLYVAENLADSLAVVDLARRTVVQRLPAGSYPYDVAVGTDGTVYVSQWGGAAISTFAPHGDRLVASGAITAGRHPSALVLNAAGTRLFAASASTDAITVIDTHGRMAITALRDTAPAGPPEGSTPDGLGLSADGTRLYVAEADNNAVALFALDSATAGVPGASGGDRLVGRMPVEWYPTAVLARGDTLLVLNGKGKGTGPNPDGPVPGKGRSNPRSYTLGQTTGSLSTLTVPDAAGLDTMSARVARANGWVRAAAPAASYPPFRHVIYVIKENRTYDQVLGDLPEGDGDTSLVFFPRADAPNHHALAERFGVFDRFFVNAEVSADGHNWSTAAYAADYVEKTVPSNYSGRGRSYDYEGTNRDKIVDDDVNGPGTGYLWDQAQRAGVSLRNYGEFAVPASMAGGVRYRAAPGAAGVGKWIGDKPFLAAHTDSAYPGFDLDIPDQHRVDVWLEEFNQFVAADTLPALEIVRLPNDHTSGASAGMPTPRAFMADNDLALGRMVEALSRSPFWANTVMFVLEDDAQNGADHVDSHRSPLFVISAYSRPGAIHRFANTTDVLATIGAILHLTPMSQFDYYGRPLADVFAATPDTTPYAALKPAVPLDQLNPAGTVGARNSARLDFSAEDRADENLFNHVLWRAIKGPDRPYPAVQRVSVQEVQRGR
jgi:YVTN family beta-propeller protein